MGLHSTYFSINDQFTFEPRAGLSWKLSPHHSLNLGFGTHSKRESPALYLVEWENAEGKTTQPNKNLRLTKANHYVIGYQMDVSNLFYLKSEIYYQRLSRVPVSTTNLNESLLNYGYGLVEDSLVNKGTGINKGIEFTANRSFGSQYFFLASVSLYQSDYLALDSILHSTAYNNSYLVSLSTGKECVVGRKGIDRFNIGIRCLGEGGRPYTPILLDESIANGREIQDEANAYGKKAPNYFRLDFQFSYRWNKPKFSSELKLDVQNVFDQQRIIGYSFDPRRNIIYSRETGSFLPVLSFKVDF
jgi:outer membrane receptor protein involved in Fe transport